MKTFTLKGKASIPDLSFIITDLMPVVNKKYHSWMELAGLIDYTNYERESGWTITDYAALYALPGNSGVDFFTIRGTGVIVIPGISLFPTLLTENQIRNA